MKGRQANPGVCPKSRGRTRVEASLWRCRRRSLPHEETPRPATGLPTGRHLPAAFLRLTIPPVDSSTNSRTRRRFSNAVRSMGALPSKVSRVSQPLLDGLVRRGRQQDPDAEKVSNPILHIPASERDVPCRIATSCRFRCILGEHRPILIPIPWLTNGTGPVAVRRFAGTMSEDSFSQRSSGKLIQVHAELPLASVPMLPYAAASHQMSAIRRVALTWTLDD